VVAGKVAAAIGRLAADIVFMDPPYEMEGEYAAALREASAGLVIVRIRCGSIRGMRMEGCGGCGCCGRGIML
jgi:hypothetical protein